MAKLDIDGQQRRRLNEAIGDAFTVARLRQMLDYRLDKRLDDIGFGNDYAEIRFKVIQSAQAQGWTSELLIAARQENPGNAALYAFAQEVGLTPSSPAVEREIRRQSPYFDPAVFRRRLGELEGQICRIEFPVAEGTVYGTGFLVGPDAVVTNHHVLAPVISEQVDPSAVTLLFDYKMLNEQVEGVGTVHRLAAEGWLIDASPLSEIDLQADPKSSEPSADELDYAVVRLSTAAGSMAIGNGTDDAPPRGWITAAAPAHPCGADDPLFIIQHPSHRALKLALEMSGVLGTYAGGTRIRHSVNTEGGSSGSPCFNSEWELVGIHHVGDPNFARPAAFNEAIAIEAVLDLLGAHDKLEDLGTEVV